MTGWFLTATGMGTAYPRTTAAVRSRSPSEQHGRYSSALTIADSLGGAVAIAVVGLVFAALGAAGSGAGPDASAFAGALLCSLGIGVVAANVARRA